MEEAIALSNSKAKRVYKHKRWDLPPDHAVRLYIGESPDVCRELMKRYRYSQLRDVPLSTMSEEEFLAVLCYFYSAMGRWSQ
ncbi:MAG: hypothetical protein ACP5IE_02555 [Infirmifilum sp.]